MSSLAASIRLIEAGVEPVYQLVCRDRNMLALESDLIAAASWGIENVLALTGDHHKIPSSDHPNAKPVYDLDACSLLKVISGTNEGADIEGLTADGDRMANMPLQELARETLRVMGEQFGE